VQKRQEEKPVCYNIPPEENERGQLQSKTCCSAEREKKVLNFSISENM